LIADALVEPIGEHHRRYAAKRAADGQLLRLMECRSHGLTARIPRLHQTGDLLKAAPVVRGLSKPHTKRIRLFCTS
jgi:hypothetical protein